LPSSSPILSGLAFRDVVFLFPQSHGDYGELTLIRFGTW
jgi:hypothetical protein